MAPTPSELTTTEGVQAYIANTPFASHTVTSLSGGTGNFAYRIHLSAPFEGQETLVLKHAEPYIKNLVSFAFSLKRQTFEYEAMTRIKEWLPADSLVTVPTIYHFDRELHVLIMEDCGPSGVPTLKDFLCKSEPSILQNLADKIGASLGRFLGEMHTWSRTDPRGLLGLFAGNTQALHISAWVTHGRTVQTLTEDLPPALADPPIEVSAADLDVLRKAANEMSAAITAARDVFVMGDFWPGNIMVKLDAEQNLERLYILDWELAKPGVPGVEIGQFCAEVDLVRRFVPSTKDAVKKVLETFLHAYAQECGANVKMARDALIHWGTHMVVFTPRVAWGDKQTTRQVVKDGVQIIVSAAGASKQDLRESLVGPLFSQ
ncbi:hypothetical protein H0H81_003073 [Sphagnurus paluster]|uniref:Aminoglycoside phosphotransferase domain-containing protein n=1 Tax=Sphagnurus paluster TaxID=117069 RepID=A0A9P7GT14_9AGAR|nr:hypothetical protein H0H81_003073 [Sphagnurus paluster]